MCSLEHKQRKSKASHWKNASHSSECFTKFAGTGKAWFINMKIGRHEFETDKHTYIMGILNVTPDSFSDGGLYLNKELILKRAEEMIREGCDIIDVGGESTRPGYEKVHEEVEIERVTPVIEILTRYFETPVSLDTYKVSVAKAGIEAGVSMINDIWGLTDDSEMANLIAAAKIACCVVHNRKKINELNHDLISAMKKEFAEAIKAAKNAGINEDKIIFDPGIGFGKTYHQNLYVLNHLSEFKTFGYPCLLGASRKSVIGITLDSPVNERLEGTIITTVMAVLSGYAFVRVHDILANKRSIKMAEAILAAKELS